MNFKWGSGGSQSRKTFRNYFTGGWREARLGGLNAFLGRENQEIRGFWNATCAGVGGDLKCTRRAHDAHFARFRTLFVTLC